MPTQEPLHLSLFLMSFSSQPGICWTPASADGGGALLPASHTWKGPQGSSSNEVCMESPGPTPEGLRQGVWTSPAHGSQWRAPELAHLLYPWIQTPGSQMGSQGTAET